MKKLLMIFTLVVAIFLLVACEDKPTDKVVTDEILSLIHIGFESEDHEASVTNNINLVTTLEGFDDVILTWTSSEPDTIQIEGNLGIVNRKEIDTPVTLSVEVKVLEDTEYKYFNLIVLFKIQTSDISSLRSS